MSTPLEKSAPNDTGLVDATTATFALYGDDLDPPALTALLGVSPTQAHRRGDANGRYAPFRTGAWLLTVEGKQVQPADLIADLLQRLPDDPSLWEGLARDHRIEVRLGLFLEADDRGFDLSPELVMRLARYRAALNMDIYGT